MTISADHSKNSPIRHHEANCHAKNKASQANKYNTPYNVSFTSRLKLVKPINKFQKTYHDVASPGRNNSKFLRTNDAKAKQPRSSYVHKCAHLHASIFFQYKRLIISRNRLHQAQLHPLPPNKTQYVRNHGQDWRCCRQQAKSASPAWRRR